MNERWRPSATCARLLRQWARGFADALSNARPRVPHRDGRRPRGELGGSLVAALRSGNLVVEKPWGAVCQLAKLGQKLYWILFGTRSGGKLSRVGRVRSRKRVGGVERQVARPVMPEFDLEAAAKKLEAEAFDSFDKRDSLAEAA